MLVGSDRFEPLAEQVASSLGASWLPEVVVSHPIGGLTEHDLQAICEAAWTGLQAEVGEFTADASFSNTTVSSTGTEQRAASSGAAEPSDTPQTPAGDDPGHPPGVQAALDRLQEIIDEGYRLELGKESDGTHVLYVIAEDEACADCLVPDEILASILTTEVASNGVELGEVRVEHGPPA